MNEKELDQVEDSSPDQDALDVEELCDDDLDNVAGGWTGDGGGGG